MKTLIVILVLTFILATEAFAGYRVNRIGNTDWYSDDNGNQQHCSWIGNTYWCN